MLELIANIIGIISGIITIGHAIKGVIIKVKQKSNRPLTKD